MSLFGIYLNSFKNKLPPTQIAKHSDRHQEIEFSILPHFCWFVFKDILPFQLGSEHVQDRFLQKLSLVEMLSFLVTFLGDG